MEEGQRGCEEGWAEGFQDRRSWKKSVNGVVCTVYEMREGYEPVPRTLRDGRWRLIMDVVAALVSFVQIVSSLTSYQKSGNARDFPTRRWAGRTADVIRKIKPHDSLLFLSWERESNLRPFLLQRQPRKASTTATLSTPDTLKTTDSDTMAAVKPIVGVRVFPDPRGWAQWLPDRDMT